MTKRVPEDLTENLPLDETSEIELSDDDILDAMKHISGYLDISTEDFRKIYHLAYRHATDRYKVNITVDTLMRGLIVPLHPDMTLDVAARMLADSGYKGLPVVDKNGCVTGMLTETDFLQRLKVGNFLELLLKMLEDSFEFTHRCHETAVSAAMTSKVVTIGRDAGAVEILDAFHRHKGHSMPVVDAEGKLLGLLLKKDVFAAYKFKDSA
jgi:CBS domain-containing membrane protein